MRVAAWVEGLRDTVSRGLVLRGVIRQASGDRFDFRKLCTDVTHPRPLSRGEVCSAAFFLVMSDLCVVFPSREGIEGCVTVKVAAKADGLRDTVSRRLVLQGVICRLRVAALVFGGSAWAWPSGFGLCPEGGGRGGYFPQFGNCGFMPSGIFRGK